MTDAYRKTLENDHFILHSWEYEIAKITDNVDGSHLG